MQKSLSLGHLLLGELTELTLIVVQLFPQKPAPLGTLGQLGKVTGDIVRMLSSSSTGSVIVTFLVLAIPRYY